MTYITEKLVKVTFIAKMIAWMFASSFSLIFGAFIAKKNTECPYTPVDGNSESIRALNYR